MLNKNCIFQIVSILAITVAGCNAPLKELNQNPQETGSSSNKNSNIVFLVSEDSEEDANNVFTFSRGGTLQLDIQVKDPDTGELIDNADVTLADGQSNNDNHISYEGYYTDYDMGYVFSWDTFNLDDGDYTLTANVKYANGDESSNSIEVHVVSVNPTVSINFSPSTTMTAGETATICLDGDSAAGFNADQFALSDGTGNSNFSFTSYGPTGWCYEWNTNDLFAGTYTIHATLTDAIGNHGEETLEVTLTP